MNATLERLIKEGDGLDNSAMCSRWLGQVVEYLRLAFGTEVAEDFNSRTQDENEFDATQKGVGYLQGLSAKCKDLANENGVEDTKGGSKDEVVSRSVFIVHGHDAEFKEAVARFVEKIGLKAIILHEQPNRGRTIIEKLETNSDVAFAVVLLTPDDVGASSDDAANLQPRARQNVIFELGYFTAKLSRRRVCALHSAEVERPSDYQGVVYIPVDGEGAWRTKLAQEFAQAGMPIDSRKLLV